MFERAKEKYFEKGTERALEKIFDRPMNKNMDKEYEQVDRGQEKEPENFEKRAEKLFQTVFGEDKYGKP
jgi:hypothetical protein